MIAWSKERERLRLLGFGIRINMPHGSGTPWINRLTQHCANRAEWE
jgi:hypothetical protein